MISVLFLLAPLLATVHAAFRPSDLQGLYVFKIGRSSCPLTLQFPSASPGSSIPPSQILLNESQCFRGQVTLADTPGATIAETAGQLLSRYLSGTREAGDYLVATVQTKLECPERSFPQNTAFTFISADRDFEVSWTRVFEQNDTWLQRNGGSDNYLFEQDDETMVVGSECLYKRIDIPETHRRACFPQSATVELKDGRKLAMPQLAIGTDVRTSQGLSTVFAFTHRDPSYMAVIRLITQHGTLEASAGHYVYIDNSLQQMSAARAGMTLQHGQQQVRIDRVERGVAKGMYNPHTLSGEMFVDGFRVSCYTDAVSPALAHSLLAPIRAALRALQLVPFGWNTVHVKNVCAEALHTVASPICRPLVNSYRALMRP